MDRQKQAYLFAGLTVALWATSASAFKIALQHLEPVQLLLVAAWVSTLVLLALLAGQRKLGLLRKMGARDWARSALLGLLNPTLYYLVLFQAYNRLPAQEAQPLNFTWPIALVLLSIPLLGQRPGRRELVGVVICYLGVWVISTRGDLGRLHFSEPLGAGLAVGSSVIWASYWVLNVRDPRDETVKLFTGFLFSLIPLTVIAAAFSSPWVFAPEARTSLLAAVWVGLFEMGLTFAAWLRALSLSATTAQVARFIYLIPVLSLTCIALVLKEEIRPSTVAGLALILAGIAVGQRTKPGNTAARAGKAEPG